MAVSAFPGDEDADAEEVLPPALFRRLVRGERTRPGSLGRWLGLTSEKNRLRPLLGEPSAATGEDWAGEGAATEAGAPTRRTRMPLAPSTVFASLAAALLPAFASDEAVGYLVRLAPPYAKQPKA